MARRSVGTAFRHRSVVHVGCSERSTAFLDAMECALENFASGSANTSHDWFAVSDVNPRRGRMQRSTARPPRAAVGGTKVEVQSVLDRLRFRNPNEEQAWKPIRRRQNLELLRIVVDDHPSQCLLPPPPECTGVVCGDDRLLPVKRTRLERMPALKRRLGGTRPRRERCLARHLAFPEVVARAPPRRGRRSSTIQRGIEPTRSPRARSGSRARLPSYSGDGQPCRGAGWAKR